MRRQKKPNNEIQLTKLLIVLALLEIINQLIDLVIKLITNK